LPIGAQVWAPEGRDDLCFAVGTAIRQAAKVGYQPPAVATEAAR
jgi:hypothetical protein